MRPVAPRGSHMIESAGLLSLHPRRNGPHNTFGRLHSSTLQTIRPSTESLRRSGSLFLQRRQTSSVPLYLCKRIPPSTDRFGDHCHWRPRRRPTHRHWRHQKFHPRPPSRSHHQPQIRFDRYRTPTARLDQRRATASSGISCLIPSLSFPRVTQTLSCLGTTAAMSGEGGLLLRVTRDERIRPDRPRCAFSRCRSISIGAQGLLESESRSSPRRCRIHIQNTSCCITPLRNSLTVWPKSRMKESTLHYLLSPRQSIDPLRRLNTECSQEQC